MLIVIVQYSQSASGIRGCPKKNATIVTLSVVAFETFPEERNDASLLLNFLPKGLCPISGVHFSLEFLYKTHRNNGNGGKEDFAAY